MQPGTGRILTTHSGSLPRPPRFLSQVLAREAGEPVDEAQFADEVRAAVRDIVRLQAEAGVDVLNDGEMSKPSYATYVKDRLTGFGGEGSMDELMASVLAVAEFPDFAQKMAQLMGSMPPMKLVSCDGPVAYAGQSAVQSDIEDLKAATRGVAPASTSLKLSRSMATILRSLSALSGVFGWPERSAITPTTNGEVGVSLLNVMMPAEETRQPPPTIILAEKRRLRGPANCAITRNGTFMHSQERPVCKADHPLTSW